MKKILFLIILVLTPAVYAGQSMIQSHNLELNFDLPTHSFKAVDNMTIKGNDILFHFLLNKNFKIAKITVQNKKTKFKESTDFDWKLFEDNLEESDTLYFRRAKLITVKINKKFVALNELSVKIEYSGSIYDTSGSSEFSRTSISEQTVGVIGNEGIYLSPASVYYPSDKNEMVSFNATLITPKDYLTVTDGKMSYSAVENDKNVVIWQGEKTTDGLYISGAKWQLFSDKEGAVDIYGFFFPEDKDIALQYIDAVKGYLKLYDGLLGRYPYSKFAIVENFFSTGYGMPSWTLLGKDVVKLPWIVNISLGHEVCHNWWGNGVFVDYKSGNWCEGLTTYCADYLYKERKSESDAREYRRNLNQDYTAYVNSGNDFPLTDFRERDEAYTRTIGYGKSAMVFHMLRKYVGDENFWKSLQSFYTDNLFKKASWNDIRASFEKQTGKNLKWFFDQWVTEKGSPVLELKSAGLDKIEGQDVINIDVNQPEPFRISLPLTIQYENSAETVWFQAEPGLNSFALACNSKPISASVDPDFNVFRRLDKAEYPASLSEVFGAVKPLYILPSSADSAKSIAYSQLADILNKVGGAEFIGDKNVDKDILAQNSLMIFGSPFENSLYSTLEKTGFKISDWILFSGTQPNFILMGQSFSGSDISYMIAVRNPLNPSQSMVFFSASSPEEILRSGKKLIHYGKYSCLVFDKGKNILKGEWEVNTSPLKAVF